MNYTAFKPILNTALPSEVRCTRLERARDHERPEGETLKQLF
jgi:hypothetical protein